MVCHQVQLPFGAAPVSFDDAIAVRLKQGSGQILRPGSNRCAPVPGAHCGRYSGRQPFGVLLQMGRVSRPPLWFKL
jgi:hypothetical protein